MYHETSNDVSESDGEGDDDDTESSAIEEDYGEEDGDSDESSVTEYNPSDKLYNHYVAQNPSAAHAYQASSYPAQTTYNNMEGGAARGYSDA